MGLNQEVWSAGHARCLPNRVRKRKGWMMWSVRESVAEEVEPGQGLQAWVQVEEEGKVRSRARLPTSYEHALPKLIQAGNYI